MKGKAASRSDAVFTFNRLLWLLVIASFALRVAYLNDGIFHFDEVSLVEAIEDTYETGRLHPMANYRYGTVAINTAVYAFLNIFSPVEAEWSVRFASALFGAVGVLLLALLARRLFKDDLVALGSGLLLSTSPVFLSLSTFGKEHTISTAMLLLAFLLLAKYHDEGRWWLAALAGTTMGVSLSVRESNLVFIPLFLLSYICPSLHLGGLWRGRRRWMATLRQEPRLRKEQLASCLLPLACIAAVLFAAHLGEMVGYTLTREGTGIVSFKGVPGPALHQAYYDLAVALRIYGLVLAIFGLIAGWTMPEWRRGHAFAAAWAAMFLYFGNTNGYSSRHLTELLPAMVMLAAVGARLVTRKRRWVGATLILLTVVSMLVYTLPIISYRHDHSGPKEMALAIRNLTEPDAVIIAMDDAPFIKHYADREVIGHPVSQSWGDAHRWFLELDALLANGTPVYALVLVERIGDRRVPQITGYDGDGTLYALMQRRYPLELVGKVKMEDFHFSTIYLLPFDVSVMRLSPNPYALNASIANRSTG